LDSSALESEPQNDIPRMDHLPTDSFEQSGHGARLRRGKESCPYEIWLLIS